MRFEVVTEGKYLHSVFFFLFGNAMQPQTKKMASKIPPAPVQKRNPCKTPAELRQISKEKLTCTCTSKRGQIMFGVPGPKTGIPSLPPDLCRHSRTPH